MNQDVRNIIIVGSGPAGLTAALYAARGELKPLLFAGETFGGQLMTTTDIENFPGFPEAIGGQELIDRMIKQAEKYGAEIVYENVTKVDFSSNPKRVWAGDKEFSALTVVIATGASPRKLGVPGETEFWAKGVHSCATCDGFFYKNKTVAVVGGGDAAMEEALFLSRYAAKLLIVHRGSEFRASEIMQSRVLENPKIEVVWNTEVKEILGADKVTTLKVWNNKEQKESEIPVDGIFLAIGHVPNTGFLGEAIKLDTAGRVALDGGTQTSAEGVFTAGDVTDPKYRQAIVAAGMGAMAAIDVSHYLERTAKNVHPAMEKIEEV